MKRMSRALVAVAAAALAVSVTLPAHAGAPDPERQIIVYKDHDRAVKAVQALGGKVLQDLTSLHALGVRIPVGAVAKLKGNSAVDFIEQDQPRYPMFSSPQAPSPTGPQLTPWGIDAVNADPQAYAGNIKICIIDSGYSRGHEDLERSPVSVSADSGTGDPFHDGCHHGTHVAGTISALDNAIGVVGVNGNGLLPIHIVKFFDDTCTDAYSSDLAAAVGKCINEGKARVISMSLGGGTPTKTEKQAFDDALNNNVLSIAAAGNAGDTSTSYPAGYDSVMSVAAVDSALVHADFSQVNSDVEISGPGVAVRSTVPNGTGTEVQATVGGGQIEAAAFAFDFFGAASGNLFRCNNVDGLGSENDCIGATGQVCLIERGTVTFAAKVQECQRKGGVAAIIFNNSDALFTGTLEGSTIKIPAVAVSGITGTQLEGQTGQAANVSVVAGNYDFFDGTSMATPHVSGVATAVWSQNPKCKARDIRTLLDYTAHDLGAPGRDTSYGFGLVDYQNAVAHLDCDGNQEGCTLLKHGAACTSMTDCCSGVCQTSAGKQTCK